MELTHAWVRAAGVNVNDLWEKLGKSTLSPSIPVQRPCYGLRLVLGSCEPGTDAALKEPPLAVLGGRRKQGQVIKNNSQCGAVAEPHTGLWGARAAGGEVGRLVRGGFLEEVMPEPSDKG